MDLGGKDGKNTDLVNDIIDALKYYVVYNLVAAN